MTSTPTRTDQPSPRLETLDGTTVGAELDRFAALYHQVYASDLHLPDHTDPPLAGRLAHAASRPGFTAVLAHVGDRPVGYVYGYPLPVDTGWWDGLEPAPEPALVREWPGRTLAVCEALVHPSHRRGQLATRMYAQLLAGRRERRATALVASTNTVVLGQLRQLGWRHVGDLAPYPGWRRHAAFLVALDGVGAVRR